MVWDVEDGGSGTWRMEGVGHGGWREWDVEDVKDVEDIKNVEDNEIKKDGMPFTASRPFDIR